MDDTLLYKPVYADFIVKPYKNIENADVECNGTIFRSCRSVIRYHIRERVARE